MHDDTLAQSLITRAVFQLLPERTETRGTIAAAGLPEKTLGPQNFAAAFGASFSLAWPAPNAVSVRLDSPC
jgi:hypothetical protein